MSAAAPGRRYLSLVLPRLPTDLVERKVSPEERASPRAVVAMEKGALRLAAVNGAAAALGLEPGLALADARARHPDLAVSDHAPRDAARMLERLADACERYTPLIGLDGADGLVLDVTGCAHLFGGEEGLVRDLLRRVAAAGFSGRAALAATRRAAFAIARFAAGRGGAVVPAEEDLAALLAPLPLAALGLDGAEVEALARLGFRRVGELYGKPRAPLAARFGMGLLRRLDEALGHVPAAMDYRFPAPVFCAERNLPEPVERVEDVLGLAAHLASTLAEAMERHGLGARRLDLTLFRVDGQVTRLGIGTSRPLRDPRVVRRLFAEKVAALSSLDPGFGFELVRLSVREAAPLSAHQEGFDARDDGAGALDELVDRLATRFGPARVRRLVSEDRHVPEEAAREVPAQNAGGWASAAVALEALALQTLALDAPGTSNPGWADEGGEETGALLSGPSCDLSQAAPRLPLRMEAAGARGWDGECVLDRGSADGVLSRASGFASASGFPFPSAFPPPQPSPARGRGSTAAITEPAGSPWTPPPPPETLSLPQGKGGMAAPAMLGKLAAAGHGEGLPSTTARSGASGMAPPSEPPAALSRLRGRVGRGPAPDVPEVAAAGNGESLSSTRSWNPVPGMEPPAEPPEAFSSLRGRVGRGLAPEVPGEGAPAGNVEPLPPAATRSVAPGMEPLAELPKALSRLWGRVGRGLAPEVPGEAATAGSGESLPSTRLRNSVPGMEPPAEPSAALSLLQRKVGRGPANMDVSLFPSERRQLLSAAGGLPPRKERGAPAGHSPLPLAGEGWEGAGPRDWEGAAPRGREGAGSGRQAAAPAHRRDGWVGLQRGALHADDTPDLAGPSRPLRLLDKPEPVEAVAEVPDGPPIRFRWRRVNHVVVRAEGPERIAAEWWRARAELPARDYFRVETATGHRFWLFRAGLYGQDGGPPAWFIHGLFG